MDSLHHIKTVRVTNPKNTVIQVPGVVTDKWGINIGDAVEVYYDSETDIVMLKPRRGYLGNAKA